MARYHIVGMRFHPPALAILSVLPGQTPLLLIPESNNEFDANAIRVVVETKDISKSEYSCLADALMGYGFSLEDVLSREQCHLGYVPREDAVSLAVELNNTIAKARLSFSPKGQPVVELVHLTEST